MTKINLNVDVTPTRGMMLEIVDALNVELGASNGQHTFVVEEIAPLVTAHSLNRSWFKIRLHKANQFWFQIMRLTDTNRVLFQFIPLADKRFDFIELSLDDTEKVFGNQFKDYFVDKTGLSLGEYITGFYYREIARAAAVAKSMEQLDGWGTF